MSRSPMRAAVALCLLATAIAAASCGGRAKTVRAEAPLPPDPPGEWDAAVRACEEGDSSGCFTAALAYEHGDGPRRSSRRAGELYARGCELGDSNACVLSANVELEGEPTAEVSERARRWLTQACFEGDSELGCLVLGTRASEETWESGDAARDSAIKAWAHACEAYESVDGCYFAGTALRERKSEGEGDLARAFRYLEVACTFEHLEACRIAADARACGEGVPEDVPRAIRDHLAACRRGDAPACSQATSFYSVLDEAERAKLDVNLGPVPFLLALRSAQRGLAKDAEALAAQLPADEAAWIRAATAFDRGDHSAARETLVQLRQARPESPEAVLLEVAIAAAEAGEPLYLSVVRAWADMGRPDLRAGGLVEPPLKFWDIECRSHYRPWLSAEEVAKRLALADLSQGSDGFPDAVKDAAAKTRDDAPLAERLGAVLALTGKETRTAPRDDWERARRRLLQTFASGKDAFSVIARLAGEEEGTPLSKAEQEALYSATAWRIPKRELRAAVDAQAKTLPDDGTWGEAPRLMATVGLANVADAVQVAARAQATAPALSPKERQRLGRALMRIGEETFGGGWVMEAYLATALFGAGAELTGDPKDAARRDEATAQTRALLERDGVPELGSWPSKRLADDQLRSADDDEVRFQRTLDELSQPKRKK